ncbi:MAG: hypothetical protein KGL39_12830 [Patescibacteria group bacterium]|nr:hypothetical protein [Patescibacteria group bacterium]
MRSPVAVPIARAAKTAEAAKRIAARAAIAPAACCLAFLVTACGGSNGSVPHVPAASGPPTYAQASATTLPETLAQVESGSVPDPIPAFDVQTVVAGQETFMGYVTAASQSGSVWTVSGTMQAPYTTFTPVGTHCSLRWEQTTGDVVLFQCDVPN